MKLLKRGLIAVLVTHIAFAQEGTKVTAQPTLKGAITTAGSVRDGAFTIRDGAFELIRQDGTERIALSQVANLEVTISDPQNTPEPSPAANGAIPAPWRNRDLGRTVAPGKVRWNDGQFVISVSPQANDERFSAFHLVYAPVEGDCEIQARIVSVGNRDEGSSAGIVICDGTTPENRKALLRVRPYGEKGVSFRRWGYQGGSSSGEEIPSLKLPYWVKLVRQGFDVAAYYSPDGRRWKLLKVSPGKMRDQKVYVGLTARVEKGDRLSEVVIDNVSINGEGRQASKAMLPHVVLRSGSRLASDIAKADRTGFYLDGRWKGTALTSLRVARVEFFHPLPDDLTSLVEGERSGLLTRTGDFAEGEFDSMSEGKIRLGSVLFGVKEYSVLDQADCLVLRKVAEKPAQYLVETLAGSLLRAQAASLQGDELVLEVEDLGEVRFQASELKSLQKL